MSGSTDFPFGKLVPGFDFLQNLASSATKGASQVMPQLPNLGSWIAPTLDPQELEKRIEELKTVQYWLDQNAIALKATIQALEVQKMTLATLRGMNVAIGDVASAFKLKGADPVPASDSELPGAARTARRKNRARMAGASATPASAAAPGGVIDPMQWWGALTQQFQQIASTALKDAAQKGAIDATRNMATGIAKGALKTAGWLAVAARDSAVKRVTGRGAAARAAATQSGKVSR